MTSPFISVIQSDRGPLKLQFNDGDAYSNSMKTDVIEGPGSARYPSE